MKGYLVVQRIGSEEYNNLPKSARHLEIDDDVCWTV